MLMDLQSLAKILAVTCGGIFSGAALYVTLVEHPARMECGTQLAATQFGPSYRRGAIMQALLDVVGSLLAASVWVRSGSVVWLAGAALFVTIVPYTLLVILPTNKQLLDASLDRSSNRARALLVRWSYLHAVRTVVGLATFVLFAYLIAVGK